MIPDQLAVIKSKLPSGRLDKCELRALLAEIERARQENIALRSRVADLLKVCHATWLKLARCQDALAAERGYGSPEDGRQPIESIRG